jgi:hypothetical protein
MSQFRMNEVVLNDNTYSKQNTARKSKTQEQTVNNNRIESNTNNNTRYNTILQHTRTAQKSITLSFHLRLFPRDH